MDTLKINNNTVYCFVSDYVGTNMYLLIEKKHALIIDPHLSEDLINFLRMQNVSECTILLTHEHSDNTCGIPVLEKHFRIKVICQKNCADVISSRVTNHPKLTLSMLAVQDYKNGTNNAELFSKSFQEYEYQADITFDSDFEFFWYQHKFVFTFTPGHSKGGCCINWNDTVIFVGDSLLQIFPVITRLPGGSTKQYKNITLPFLKSLSKDLVVLPGHGPAFRMADMYQGVVHVEFTGI